MSKLFEVRKLHIRGAQARGGPRGVMIEFSPSPEILQAAGLPPDASPLRMVLSEDLALQLAKAIPTHLAGHAPEGETLH